MAQIHQLTAHQRMADQILRDRGTNLEDFLRDRRNAGRSYEQIGRDLANLTGEAVDVSFQSVRRWLEDFDIEKVTV